MELRHICEDSKKQAIDFLKRYEDTSQFLLNNMNDFGLKAGKAPHSGNFKMVTREDKVVAVFCLTNKGILLLQAEEDFSREIYESCVGESRAQIKGMAGDWKCIEPFYTFLKQSQPPFRASFDSVETLFSYELVANDTNLRHDSDCDFLKLDDFNEYLPLRMSYLKELNLPDQLSEKEKKELYEAGIKNKTWWGLRLDGELVSIAGLNSTGKEIGQVGGVFTKPNYRRKGLSRRVMFHLLKDCRDYHGHKKNILFTGEEEHRFAHLLYDSMGYKRSGKFALILG